MSFNRLNYDTGAYQHSLKESVGPSDYMLGTPRVDCSACFFPSPYVRMNRFGDSVCEKEIIDVDSELMGITRKNSRCPTNQYIPGEKDYCVAKAPKECRDLDAEDTRLSNPPCTLRSTGWNRWEWMCQNPQNHAVVPFEYMINNSLVVKDNHRPLVPRPIDPSASLPTPVALIPDCPSGEWPMEDNKYAPRKDLPSTHWRCAEEIRRY